MAVLGLADGELRLEVGEELGGLGHLVGVVRDMGAVVGSDVVVRDRFVDGRRDVPEFVVFDGDPVERRRGASVSSVPLVRRSFARSATSRALLALINLRTATG